MLLQTACTCTALIIKTLIYMVCVRLPQEFGVVSYTLLLSLIEYKTLVMRGDMDAAEELLPSIPKASLYSC